MISVVIPLYNHETTIAHALECVLSQTYQNFEVVVVDDGSMDGGAEQVEKFTDSRIRLIRQPNGGVSMARNTGIREARGEYIAFLDADDEWDKIHLEVLHGLMCCYPQCQAYSTSYNVSIVSDRRNIILNKLPFSSNSGILDNYFEVASCSHPPVCSTTTCISKNLLIEIGGFPLGITSGEDLLTWAKIAIRTNWAYSKEITATVMLGDESVAKSRRRHDPKDEVGLALLKLYKNNQNVCGLGKYISLWYKMRAMGCLQSIDRLGVYEESIKSLKFNPLNFKVYVFCVMAIMPKSIIKILIEHFSR